MSDRSCQSCRHSRRRFLLGERFLVCEQPVVMGQPLHIGLEVYAKLAFVGDAREESGLCGPSARYWEPKLDRSRVGWVGKILAERE